MAQTTESAKGHSTAILPADLEVCATGLFSFAPAEHTASDNAKALGSGNADCGFLDSVASASPHSPIRVLPIPDPANDASVVVA